MGAENGARHEQPAKGQHHIEDGIAPRRQEHHSSLYLQLQFLLSVLRTFWPARQQSQPLLQVFLCLLIGVALYGLLPGA